MCSKTSIEIVRIFDKDFPVNIPDDLGDKPLEVVNEKGDILAIFYNSSCLINKPKELEKFILEYDVFFDQDLTHIDTDPEDTDEDAISEREEWIKEHPNFDKYQFTWKIKREIQVFSAICRLTFPFHLSKTVEEDCYTRFNWWGVDCFDEISELAFTYENISIIAKILDILFNTQNSSEFTECIEKYLNNLHENRFLYDHSELLFNCENIDRCIEIADGINNNEIIEYLSDYKKHLS